MAVFPSLSSANSVWFETCRDHSLNSRRTQTSKPKELLHTVQRFCMQPTKLLSPSNAHLHRCEIGYVHWTSVCPGPFGSVRFYTRELSTARVVCWLSTYGKDFFYRTGCEACVSFYTYVFLSVCLSVLSFSCPYVLRFPVRSGLLCVWSRDPVTNQLQKRAGKPWHFCSWSYLSCQFPSDYIRLSYQYVFWLSVACEFCLWVAEIPRDTACCVQPFSSTAWTRNWWPHVRLVLQSTSAMCHGPLGVVLHIWALADLHSWTGSRSVPKGYSYPVCKGGFGILKSCTGFVSTCSWQSTSLTWQSWSWDSHLDGKGLSGNGGRTT